MIITGPNRGRSTADPANRQLVRRRRLWGAGIAAAVAAGVGLLVFDLPQPHPAFAATPDLLPITRSSDGTAPLTLIGIARAAQNDTTPSGCTVDHLITDYWALNSVIDGKTVTSAVFPSQREFWRAGNEQARTIDIYLPPLVTNAADRDAFGDTGAPDSTPVRNDYPAGTFAAAFSGRPPTDPGRLARWLARSSRSDTAILDGVTDLLQERALTSPERAAVLTVLATRTALTYAGTSADRAGRPGVAFTTTSDDSGGHITHVLLLNPATGRFLAYEQVLTAGAPALKVRRPAVIGYRTYRQAETVAAIP